MNRAVQLGNPEGRLDVLAVRLIECAIKARYGVPGEAVLSFDLLRAAEIACNRVGLGGFNELRPRLVSFAHEFGVETEQTLPELARNLGLLRGPRARVKRRAACTR